MKRKDALRKMMAPISVETRDDGEGEEAPSKSRSTEIYGPVAP